MNAPAYITAENKDFITLHISKEKYIYVFSVLDFLAVKDASIQFIESSQDEFIFYLTRNDFYENVSLSVIAYVQSL